jgi:hypothetical protein
VAALAPASAPPAVGGGDPAPRVLDSDQRDDAAAGDPIGVSGAHLYPVPAPNTAFDSYPSKLTLRANGRWVLTTTQKVRRRSSLGTQVR